MIVCILDDCLRLDSGLRIHAHVSREGGENKLSRRNSLSGVSRLENW